MQNKKSKSIVKSAGNKPSKVSSKNISKTTKAVSAKKTIGQLERDLLKFFPEKTACDWDKTGLLVGDKSAKIKKIAVCLDPTVKAVRTAKNLGCNLLLTHHPAYLGEIEKFLPADSVAQADGALVYEAANSGVALMNFHTALDVSKAGGAVLPKLLNISEKLVLCPTDGVSQTKSKLGFGRICALKTADKKMNLEQMAARCKSVFGRAPRVWGDFSTKLKKIVTTTGSTGRLEDEDGVLKACIDQNVDCIICGEIKYHDALAISDAGICVIELGHDLSELPLCGVLISKLCDLGIKKQDISYIDQSNNWSYQTSILV